MTIFERLRPAWRPAQEPPPKWGLLDVAFMLSIALPALLASTLVVLGLSFALPAWRTMRAAQVLAIQFLFWGLWLSALYGVIRVRYGGRFWASLGWVRPPRGMGHAAGLGVLIALGVIGLGLVLRPPQIPMPLLELLKDPWSLALVGVFAVTLGPLCEELAFRGFLLPWLARVIRPGPAVLATSALFAALHGPEYAWSWRHVLLIAVAGSAFGAVRLHSGSTAAAAAAHAAYNLVFFVSLLPQLGRWCS